MKSVRINGEETAIVTINTEDKRYYNLHTGTAEGKLWLYNEANSDGRVAQPTTGIIEASSSGKFKKGWYVLFHHNACISNQLISESGTEKVYRIAESLIMGYCRKRPQVKDDILPAYPNLFVDRMFINHSTEHIIDPITRKQKNYMKVVKKPKSIFDIKVGDVIMVYDKSDYEMNYNLAGFFETIIKVDYEKDVIGVVVKK